MFYDKEGKFSVKLFLKYLETEGKSVEYNGTREFFESRSPLPPYFDESKIKRAQKFFQKNIASMLTVSTAGLMALLSDAHGNRFLLATNKSSEPISAYKRYRDTMFHMISWYEGNFTPGSELWKSLTTVRHMHNAATKLGDKLGLVHINQAELTISQFGFMGFAIARQKEFGLESASEEDLEALVHFWRVIGYTMGVRDEFNMCRESVEETRLICNAIIEKIGEFLSVKHKDSLLLQFAALDGSRMVFPTIESKLFLNFVYELTYSNVEERRKHSYKINSMERVQLAIFKRNLELCKYKFHRNFINWNARNLIHMVKNYPEIIEHKIRGIELLTLI